MEFKDGKVFSTFLFDKLEYKWIRYDIKKDTTYMDEETEVHYWEVLASHTNEKDETIVMTFKVTDWEIEGSYKLTKKDKTKKYYELTGKERIKVKKEKKKKE